MSTPKDLLNFSELNEMTTRFRNKNTGTKSVWLSLDKLKEYISFIEKASKAKEIEISGIRAYFLTNTDMETTLGFNPTFKDTDSNSDMPHVSFDPVLSSTKKPAILSELMSDKSKSADQSSVLNRMEPCPKQCPKK
jgi:hypothetical protein